jgi:hypothetical protein
MHFAEAPHVQQSALELGIEVAHLRFSNAEHAEHGPIVPITRAKDDKALQAMFLFVASQSTRLEQAKPTRANHFTVLMILKSS